MGGFWGSIGSSTGRPDRLCEELGWSIDYRQGNVIGLNFNGDHVSSKRIIIIAFDREAEIITFSCRCRGRFHSLPADMLPALMMKNNEVIFGSWAADTDEGAIGLKMQYTALAAGVDVKNFSMICSMILQEVALIEGYMNSRGMI